MTETQLATLTDLLQKLVAQNSSSQSKSQHELPKRILRSLRDIANDMNMDFDSIPQKTLRGCGKFIKEEYINHFNRCPLQTHCSRTCMYTKKEVKFVQPLIRKYFEMHSNGNSSDNSSESD